MNKNTLWYILALLLPVSLIIVSCDNDNEEDGQGNLQLNFKMEYAGEPLVLNSQFMYPAGMLMRVSNFTLLMSDLQVDDKQLDERSFLNIGDAHLDAASAEEGLSVLYEDIDVGNYDNISFHIGVNSELNATTPDDYSSDDALAQARHWAGWGSYIFASIEGQFDGVRDGDLNEEASTMALHMGGDQLYTPISRSVDFNISSNNTTEIDVIIDLEQVFMHDGLYNIDSIPTTHMLSRINSAQEIVDGISATLKMQ